MKYLFVLVVVLLTITPTLASITETTAFYNQKAGTQLYYKSYSGFEDVNWYFPKGSAAIYYSLWQGFNLPFSDKSVPIIIWLQGGPGGPSQFGCFNQLGPLFIKGSKDNLKPIQNPWGWNSFGHLLCIDQPLGVGFSYNNNTKKVDNTRDATNHFENFMYNFYANNQALGLSGNPLYIAGESYAGHYISSFAQRLATNKSLNINLQGVLIGDGWVDPIQQINNYDSFLSSVGVASLQARDTIAYQQVQAATRIMNGDLYDAAGFINWIIADDNVANKYYNNMNVLNYKQYDQGNINPDYWYFLQANKASLGVPSQVKYVDNNEKMYIDFSADLSSSYKRQLQKLLNLNIRTLIYNGQNDYIVNTPGVLAYLNTLEWVSAQQWRDTPKKIWKEYGGKNIGWYKNHRNLIFCVVRNAGHLLPADQPVSAYWMLDKYFTNSW